MSRDVTDGDPTKHEIVSYDLDGWSDAQRRALVATLRMAEIAHAFDGPVVTVSRQHQHEVDEIIDLIDADEGTERNDIPPASVDTTTQSQGVAIASPLQRIIGAIIDGTVLTIISLGAFSAGATRWQHHNLALSLFGWGLIASYDIAPVAVWGRTPGKLVAGTRVVTSDGRGLPGWRRATIRWVITIAPKLIVAPLAGAQITSTWFRILDAGWMICVYVGVLTDPSRQGLHDHAAGTIVVRTRPPVQPRQ